MAYFSEEVQRFMELVGPSPSPVQQEMAAAADEAGFPIIGPEAGGILRILARLVGASRVFEFGSGFGYSATWFAGGLPADGEMVLTEYDPENAERAREYLDRAGVGELATIEVGDACEIVAEYPGPFDVVLFDHEKSRYPEAIPLVESKLPAGGVLVADNMMRGPMEFETVLRGLEGGDIGSESAGGVVAYLEQMAAHDAFATTVLPVGNGLAVSVKVA